MSRYSNVSVKKHYFYRPYYRLIFKGNSRKQIWAMLPVSHGLRAASKEGGYSWFETGGSTR
jgi:hypothetical protein